VLVIGLKSAVLLPVLGLKKCCLLCDLPSFQSCKNPCEKTPTKAVSTAGKNHLIFNAKNQPKNKRKKPLKRE
jgi:hypothetical protein